MEGQLGLSDLSVVAWVSAVEGCGSHCMQTVLHRSLPNDSAQVVTTLSTTHFCGFCTLTMVTAQTEVLQTKGLWSTNKVSAD